MALQKLFYIFQDPHSPIDHLVYVDDFYNYFIKHSKERRSYIVRSLKNIKLVDEKEAVSVRDILRYCFNHYETYNACKEIVKEVEKEILFSKDKTENEYLRSSLELYKLIAKTEFGNVGAVFQQTVFDCAVIRTLVQDHVQLFTEDEWKKIIWFEHHFSKEVSGDEHSYEELLKLKWAKYSNLLSFTTCREALEEIAKKHLKYRLLRKEAVKQAESIKIYAGKKHLVEILDSQILTFIEEYYPEIFGSVTVFDTDSENNANQVHVIIEVSNCVNVVVYSHLCQAIEYDLRKRHGLDVSKIIFLNSDTIHRYHNKDGIIARFHLRDDIFLEKLSDYVFYWETTDSSERRSFLDASFSEVDSNCVACYNNLLPPPLTKRDFSIVQEWYLDTPIEIQMILGAFINTDSIRRVQNVEKYMKNKLEKLYIAYDALLNSLNKNYTGVFQQANTDELLYDYRNIKSVFNITYAAGATSSLNKAETDWKKRADEEVLYQNTFINRYPLTYNTDAGLETKEINLRRCHIILMLDNLVRLKTVKDNNPTDSRSKQMCTLPLTIQGLPLDTALTETWHDVEQCDGSEICSCKSRISLTKEDIPRVLLATECSEGATYKQFLNLFAWGHMELWQKLPGMLILKI